MRHLGSSVHVGVLDACITSLKPVKPAGFSAMVTIYQRSQHSGLSSSKSEIFQCLVGLHNVRAWMTCDTVLATGISEQMLNFLSR